MIAGLALVCICFVIYGISLAMKKANWEKKYRNRVLLVVMLLVSIWLIAVGGLAAYGFFSDFSMLPPRPAFVILLPLPVMILIMMSGKFGELLLSIPPHWLIYFQSFRIAVECLLLAAFLKGVLPVQMTFEGLNFDILTGILSIPVGYLCTIRKKGYRTLAVLFNIMGLLLLLAVVTIAVLSLPLPIRYFHHDPSTAIAAAFPYIYLPSVLVVLAYTLHLFSLRQLFLLKKKDLG